MTVRDWMNEARTKMAQAGIEPGLEPQILAGWALKLDRAQLLAHGVDRPVPPELEAALLRRLSREPLAYITGVREFYGRTFRVNPSVLIPRHETETLIDLALELGSEGHHILDLGTGSGCLAITLALERPDWEVSGSDISQASLATARENAAALSATVRWLHADGFEALREAWDLIVSNPPYIALNADLMPEVGRHEPAGALFAGATGFEFYERLAREAKERLLPGGSLILEAGDDQADGIRQRFVDHGWRAVASRKDLDGRERALCFQPI